MINQSRQTEELVCAKHRDGKGKLLQHEINQDEANIVFPHQRFGTNDAEGKDRNEATVSHPQRIIMVSWSKGMQMIVRG